jgi:hypothetical protein
MNNYKTTINVLTDGETWTTDDCTYFKKFALIEDSDAFDSLESEYKETTREDLLKIIEGLESQIAEYSDNLTLAVDLLDKRSFDEYLEVMQ